MQRAGLFLGTTLAFVASPLGWGTEAADAAARPAVFSVQTPRALAKLGQSLSAAQAIASTDVWAVGGIIAHFDGTAWSLNASLPQGAELADVAGTASNDVWAAGRVALSGGGSQTLVEHWNGAAWSVIPTPPLTGQQASFSGIVAFTNTNVWAAGTYVVGGTSLQPLFEHWDGQTWTIVDGHAVGNHFIAKISAVSPTDIWAVGSAGGGDQGTPFAEHWNGSAWRQTSVPLAGIGGMFNNVRALAANNVWAVGSATLASVGGITITANPIQTLIEHWDGTSWSIVPSPNIGASSVFQENRLFGLGVLSANDIWAVGQFALPDGSTRELGLALRWNGTAWSIAAVPDVGTLTSYSGVASTGGALWIVGAGGFPGVVTGFAPLIAFSPRG